MFMQIDFQTETLFVLAVAGLLLHLCLRLQRHRPAPGKFSTEDYLYKIARITGVSEYEIFRKSAENWPVSEAMIEAHFKDYLLHQATPCYVNDFVRKNKRQVDLLKLPPL
jgi:hypothetical protein